MLTGYVASANPCPRWQFLWSYAKRADHGGGVMHHTQHGGSIDNWKRIVSNSVFDLEVLVPDIWYKSYQNIKPSTGISTINRHFLRVFSGTKLVNSITRFVRDSEADCCTHTPC